MTFEEARAELILARNRAITRRANELIERGFSVDDRAFRETMLNYAGSLETWRWNAMLRLARLVYPGTAEPQSQSLH
jgi:hypothetical protein